MPACPFCAEKISVGTKTCPHCDSDLINDRLPTGKSSSDGKSALIAIIVVVAGGGVVVIAILVALLLPAVQQARAAARIAQCRNQMKQIGLALHLYHETHRVFPPAYTVNANGQPLHSWRVLILPYMGQQALYGQIDLNEPWDSPKNQPFHRQMPPSFACPEGQDSHTGRTHYVAVTGDECLMRPAVGRGIVDVIDGLANTLFVGESQTAVNWMEPRDVPFESLSQLGNQPGLFGMHRNRQSGHALLGDGSVRTLSNLASDHIRALSTVAGGESVSLDY